jgi:hypothetical protein
MKIILFANSFHPIALIDSLLKQDMIAGVIAARELNHIMSDWKNP